MADWIQKRYEERERYYTEMIADAAQSPLWQGYANYSRDSERGLRRQAFEKLEVFIVEMERAPFSDRQRFVRWLMKRMKDQGYKYHLCPKPLELRIVRPTLLEWTVFEPACSEPHRWLGGFEHLRLALQVDPSDQIAREMLAWLILGQIGMNTHEIPAGYGYLGEPSEGFAALDEAEQLILGLSSEDERKRLALRIEEERLLIRQYLARH